MARSKYGGKYENMNEVYSEVYIVYISVPLKETNEMHEEENMYQMHGGANENVMFGEKTMNKVHRGENMTEMHGQEDINGRNGEKNMNEINREGNMSEMDAFILYCS